MQPLANVALAKTDGSNLFSSGSGLSQIHSLGRQETAQTKLSFKQY